MGGRIACTVATDAQIAGIRVLHDAMAGFYERRDRMEYYKQNQAIHTGIVRLSGNAFLAGQHEALQGRLKRIRFMGHEQPSGWAEAVAEHQEMIAALERREAGRLVRVLTAHLDRTWERVRDRL
jgi:DNA-binding GntR family transcriptional regulator